MDRSGRANDLYREAMPLMIGLLTDIKIHYPTINFEKDIAYVQRCSRERGWPFLTVNLPLLSKTLDRSLVEGKWLGAPQFGSSGTSVLPRFLGKLFRLIFSQDGAILPAPHIGAIRDIRAIGYLFYKYELPYSSSLEEEAVESFIRVDEQLPTSIPESVKPLVTYARALLARLLTDLDPLDLIPSHSNGAVQEGLKNHEKMTGLSGRPKHEELMPYYDINAAHWLDFSTRGRKEHFETANTARLVMIPKDSRGPRLICVEPVTQQYLQQGLKDLLYDHIESHPLTRGHVNFRDQTINGRLAILGSRLERDTVTLDMKEASDRVTWELVQEIFPPAWRRALDATRTSFVSCPNGRTILLRKFAPMGSALCFPIESLVHWSIGMATLVAGYGLAERNALRSIFVYGDDIILRGVPFKAFLRVFPLLGMKFNELKCCTSGKFRESCGTDAFFGEDVTPLKIKKVIPSNAKDPNVVSWTSYADQAYTHGNWNLARAIEHTLHDSVKCTLPYISGKGTAVGYAVRDGFQPANLLFKQKRWDPDLQIMEVKGLKMTTKGIAVRSDESQYHQTLVDLARRKPGCIPEERSWKLPYTAACVRKWVTGTCSPYNH